MGFIGDLFQLVLIQPLLNLFILLSTVTGSAGLGVILLTIFIRGITLPLTLKQMHSTRMMSALGPRMAEIKKRYKDPRRASQEQMKLYKEAGINPLGCFSSMILQFPILIALYQTFILAVGEPPESLIKVSDKLYDWEFLRSGFPLNAEFLWLHLGRPDNFALPILVAATTYSLQKMSMMPATDERQRAQNSMMNLMMPLVFGWITISLPSGLGLYYVLSNVIGMIMQYAYVGGGSFNWRALLGLSDAPVLPRALEVRLAQTEAIRGMARDDEDEPEESARGARKGPRPGREPDGSAIVTDGAAARRRRYSNGRRRGRR